MKVVSVNHINEVTTVDLVQVPVHRLCLCSTKDWLGIGIKYVIGIGPPPTVMLAGVLVHGLEANDTTLASIAKVGFQGGELTKDREMIHDACRVLRNVIAKDSVVEEIGTKAEALADFYWWLKPYLLDGVVAERQEYRLGEWLTILLP